MPKVSFLAVVLMAVSFSGCAIDSPAPASTEMRLDPNDPAYITLDPLQKEEYVGGYNDT